MIKIGIVGASGYVGGELLRLLSNHENVEIKYATSNSHKNEKISRIHPDLYGLTDLRFSDRTPMEVAQDVDLIFLALPHGTSIKYVPDLIETGVNIIDMSADFRLKDPEKYPEWYGFEHNYPDLLYCHLNLMIKMVLCYILMMMQYILALRYILHFLSDLYVIPACHR